MDRDATPTEEEREKKRMENHDPLMMGMFWGGLLVAAVPMLLSLGIGVYVLRRHLASVRARRWPGDDRE